MRAVKDIEAVEPLPEVPLSFPGFWKSRRLQLLVLLSISSGLPYWVHQTFLQGFLRYHSVDLKTIGLFSAVSLPWSLKILWSPLVDRYAFRWPGRRRSWVLLTQALLAVLMVAAAIYTGRTELRGPDGALVHVGDDKLMLVAGAAIGFAVIDLLLSFLSATHDIALDAYAVEVTRATEVGAVSGFRNGYYQIARLIAQAALAFSALVGWAGSFGTLGVCFVLFMGLTLMAVEPDHVLPPRSLKEAVVEPLVSFTRRFRWQTLLPVALFIFFYKFGDNFVGQMVNPFLADTFVSKAEFAFAVKTVGFAGAFLGATGGAVAMTRMGVGRALWVFGILQALGNGLYALTAVVHPVAAHLSATAHSAPLDWKVRTVAYSAIFAEYMFQSMASAALGALFLGLCEKRFGATQYALLTGLMAAGRTLSGLPSGFVAERLGYVNFFLLGVVLAIPGFVLLQRIAPIHQRGVLVDAER